MPYLVDCAAPDSRPLRGSLLTTGGDDCPTQAEKMPINPATVTKTTRVQTRVELLQRTGTRGLALNRPRVCIKTEIKSHTDNLVLKKASGIDNQSL
jgi:hypothetical protein